MPWIPDSKPSERDQAEALPVRSEPLLTSPYDTPDPDIWDQTVAAFERTNLVGSALASEQTRMNYSEFSRIDDSYNPYDDEDMKGFADSPDHEDRFVTVYNRKAAEAVRADIERETRNNEVLAAGGWSAMALEMGAAIIDPTILIPGAAIAKGGKLAANVTRGAAYAGLAGAVQETGLQLTQETRTKTEGVLNVTGSAIVGGMLGGALHKMLSRSEAKALAQRIDKRMAAEPVEPPQQIIERAFVKAQAAGAQSVEELDLSDLQHSGWTAGKVADLTDAVHLNPGLRTALSPSKVVRETYSRMANNPLYMNMHWEGKSLGPAAENRMKLWQRGTYASWLREAKQLHKQSRKAGEAIPYPEFMARVGRAMRRGDADINSGFVSKAAQAARAKISDPLLREAQSIGLLGDVRVTTAESYLHRMWNVRRLEAEEPQFKKITRDWLRGVVASMEKTPDDIAFLSDIDLDDYLDEVTDSIFRRLTGRDYVETPDWIVPVTRGPLKERTFGIPDRLVEAFLEDDAEVVMRRYAHTMGAEIELARQFGRADMRDQFAAIADDYKALRDAAALDKSMTPSQRQKRIKQLGEAERRDVLNMTAFRDIMRGTYRAREEATNWSAATRLALAWNFMRLLGGIVVTSATDVANIQGVHGLRAVMGEGLPQLAKSVAKQSLSANEARELGAVAETVLNSRFASMAELMDPFAYGSRAERFMDNSARIFSKFTGIGAWNDLMRTMAVVMTQSRILRNANTAFDQLGKYEKSYMGFLGIDSFMAERIAKQFKAHGQMDGRTYVPNSRLWDDQEARQVFAAAVHKDADRQVVMKDASDVPLWMRTNSGKLILQFKSFFLASWQKVTLNRLQERPHRFAEQLVLGTTIGMMIGYLKFVERGDLEQANALLENPGMWIAEGMDRSGIFSLLFEPSNTIEKLGLPIGIKSGLQAIAGDVRRDLDVSRYAQRNKLGAVMGPSAGLFKDVADFAEQVSKGELKRSGVNAALRQIPGGTLPGVRTGLYVGVRPMLHDAVE